MIYLEQVKGISPGTNKGFIGKLQEKQIICSFQCTSFSIEAFYMHKLFSTLIDYFRK